MLAASVGNCHTLLLTSSGLVCAFGYAGSGRLGLGNAIGNDGRQLAPAVVEGLRGTPLRVAIAREQHEIADLLRAHGGVVEVGPDSAGTLI